MGSTCLSKTPCRQALLALRSPTDTGASEVLRATPDRPPEAACAAGWSKSCQLQPTLEIAVAQTQSRDLQQSSDFTTPSWRPSPSKSFSGHGALHREPGNRKEAGDAPDFRGPSLRLCCSQASGLPLTTKTIICVGSYCKALCRIYQEPTTKMVLVVEGRAQTSLPKSR